MKRLKRNRAIDRLFEYIGAACTFFGLAMLLIFIGYVLFESVHRINWDFIFNFPSRKAEKAGIYTAWMGTVWVLGFTACVAIPVGVAAGVYLEEYGGKSRLASIVEVNIANLAGVPSIIYGLLGLEALGRWMNLGSGVLAGALTLSILILPILIVATREAIRNVPNSIREASFALGASRWQTVSRQVLPAAMGGIMTGVILSLSRAIGEAAPLIVVGALAYVPFAPRGPMDQFTVLPIQIFNWISRPQKAFIVNGIAAIFILLCIIFILNSTAIYLRYRWQKKMEV